MWFGVANAMRNKEATMSVTELLTMLETDHYSLVPCQD